MWTSMPTRKQRMVLNAYRELAAKVAEADAKVIELLAHPDATDDMVLSVRRTIIVSHQALRDARAKMMAAKFDPGWFDRRWPV